VLRNERILCPRCGKHCSILEPCKAPKIQGKHLEQSDVGRWVTYTPSHGAKERGTLSSFREDGAIFVRFKGPQGERCDADALSWG
jgi:hypothetical protein